MLNYNQELIVDSDTERCGSYLATNYEFFFPEMPILKEREKESIRYQMKKFQLSLIMSDSNNCQKGE